MHRFVFPSSMTPNDDDHTFTFEFTKQNNMFSIYARAHGVYV